MRQVETVTVRQDRRHRVRAAVIPCESCGGEARMLYATYRAALKDPVRRTLRHRCGASILVNPDADSAYSVAL